MTTAQRFIGWISLVAICLLLVLFPLPASAANSVLAQDSADTMVYLPIVIRPAEQPLLGSPANGAVLDTLIPTLTWDLRKQQEDAWGCFYLDDSPHPVDALFCYQYKYKPNYGQTEVGNNLLPNTVYYWRIGVASEVFGVPYIWSEERSFRTGAANGPYPSRVQLVSPANDSITGSSSEVQLAWKPVSGATKYRVQWFVDGGINGFGDLVSSPQTTITLDDRYLHPGAQVVWAVQAKNDYAYGEMSQWWKFTAP